jgi:hypothetical protein
MRFDLWMMRTYPNIPFERYADKTIGLCNAQTRRGDYERTADRVAASPGAGGGRTDPVGPTSGPQRRELELKRPSELRGELEQPAHRSRDTCRRTLHAATTLASCRQI